MALAKRNYVYADFRVEPSCPLFAKTTMAIATGAAGQEDYFLLGGDRYFEVYQDGQNDEIGTGPMFTPSANGWTIPVDNAADGFEMTRGIVSGIAQSFVVGTSPAFFIRAVMKITTIANNTVCMLGFRKLAAYAAIKAADAATALTAFAERAAIGTVAVAGTFATQTSKAEADLQTALAHAVMVAGEYVALEVAVSAAGAVTYKLGTGASAALALAALAVDASAVAFSFTNATELVPSIQVVGTAATAICDTQLVTLECGYQV